VGESASSWGSSSLTDVTWKKKGVE
jgi:hypothetical protein